MTAHAHHLVRQHVTEQLPGGLREAAQRATRAHAAAAGVAALHEAGARTSTALRTWWRSSARPRTNCGPGPRRLLGPVRRAACGADLGAAGAGWRPVHGRRPGLAHRLAAGALRRRSGHCGTRYLSPMSITEHLVACTRAGVQAGFHAIGDAALDLVVEGLRVADRGVRTDAVRARRHRVEHVTMRRPSTRQCSPMPGWWPACSRCFDALWGEPRGRTSLDWGRVGRPAARLRRPGARRHLLGVRVGQPGDRDRAVGVGPRGDVASPSGGAAERASGVRRRRRVEAGALRTATTPACWRSAPRRRMRSGRSTSWWSRRPTPGWRTGARIRDQAPRPSAADHPRLVGAGCLATVLDGQHDPRRGDGQVGRQARRPPRVSWNASRGVGLQVRGHAEARVRTPWVAGDRRPARARAGPFAHHRVGRARGPAHGRARGRRR